MSYNVLKSKIEILHKNGFKHESIFRWYEKIYHYNDFHVAERISYEDIKHCVDLEFIINRRDKHAEYLIKKHFEII